MQFKIIVNYILGFTEIMVEGYYIERFINICTSKKILLWNLKRDKSTILYARVGIKDFKRLKEVCKKTGCKMKINSKKGLPFVVNRYKKRKAFFGFLMFIILSVFVLSNFVWNIEIAGTETINDDEILKIVEEQGLKIGIFKRNVNTKEIINELRLRREDIAWVGIEIKGTNAVIKIVEANLKPEIINEEEYCNIVATKPAMILKINAQNGTPLVSQGDIVKEGDILIGGWLEGKYTGTRYVHSQGEIQAKVWYTNKQKVYLNETKKEETGNSENKYSVNINNFKINLFKTLSNFENYDTIEEIKKIKIFSDYYLPIRITKYTNNEYRNIEINYSLEEAKNIGTQRAEEELIKQVENKESILNKNINVYENEQYIEVEVTYEVKENIGAKEKIIF